MNDYDQFAILKSVAMVLVTAKKLNRTYRSDTVTAFNDGQAWACAMVLRATLPMCTQGTRYSIGAFIRQQLAIGGAQ